VKNTEIHTIWGRFRQVQTDVNNGGSGSSTTLKGS